MVTKSNTLSGANTVNKILGLILILAASCAYGMQSLIATDGRGTVVRLFPTACEAPVVELIKEEHRDKFRAAKIEVMGKTYRACWYAPEEVDTVAVILDNGTTADIPKNAFALDEGV